jgi:predicted enzyme related to lactoylglutathione lyase
MNEIVHIEIPTTDFAKSKAFYENVFGWKVTLMPEMDYATWMPADDKGVGGGFTKVKAYCECSDGCITVYIGVASIDSMLQKITGAGGAVVTGKSPVGGFGWFAVFHDSAGATVALFESAEMEK